ncbi:hypothetical protein D3OALGA1CA_1992 [Olavius algarvensis associated proteobacterium Delta 3]|nr:hypothetical protein D3OALGA1CA_1992 [Olavius algarvensis associated proteobacterium Delta 3]
MPILAAVRILKSKGYGLPNYSRFLKPIGWLNLMVAEAVCTQLFGLTPEGSRIVTSHYKSRAP